MSHILNESQVNTPGSTSSLKSTPYRNSGISKTLLTPCRRLGLSRRIKSTPNNKNQEHLLNNSCNSTPVSVPKRDLFIDTPSPIIQDNGKHEEPNTKAFCDDVDSIPEQCCNTEVESRTSTPVIKHKTKTLKSTKGKNLISRNKRTTKEKKLTVEPNNSIRQSDNNGDDDTEIGDSENTSQIKLNDVTPSVVLKEMQTSEVQQKVTHVIKSKSSFTKCLSMKKTDSHSELSTEDDLSSPPKTSTSLLIAELFTNECNVVVEDIGHVDEDTDIQISRKLSKKRCIIYSSDEDDFISSQPTKRENDENGKYDKEENWIEKINEIQNRIKLKEEQLAELKQAAIYKKLHNIKELERLINIWKKGCQDGLVYLLPKLREHADIDMLTLMKKFNVPNTIVYNANTDSFM